MKRIIAYLISILLTQNSLNAKQLLVSNELISNLKYDTLFEGQHLNEIDLFVSQLFKYDSKLNKQEILPNWIEDLWEEFSKLWRPVWGAYNEGGQTNGNAPLVGFDRSNTPIVLIDEVKSKINSDPKIYKEIFKEIYANAINTSTPNCNEDQVCTKAYRAKNAAFIYLLNIGITSGGAVEALGTNDLPNRRYFYDIAKNAINDAVTDDDWGIFNSGRFQKEFQQYRSKENIMYLCAYDFLRLATQEYDLQDLQYDNDGLRDKLQELTYQLYSRANNLWGSFSVNNNFTIMPAAAIGLAACILHDKTVRWWSISYKPERWANAAHAYMNRALWTGPGFIDMLSYGFFWANGPMSGKAGLNGYAEGCHYFGYGVVDNGLIFFNAFRNFVNRDMSGDYYSSVFSFTPEHVHNYAFNKGYKNLYEWYIQQKTPSNLAPSFDDSWATSRHFAGLSILGIPEYSTVTNYSHIQLTRAKGVDLRADFLASLNYPKEKGLSWSYENKNSGNFILRPNLNDPFMKQHYFHLLAEDPRGTSTNGWFHEHSDLGSFMIYAGEDALAIDPGYFGEGAGQDDINKSHHHNLITVDGEGPHSRDYPELDNCSTKEIIPNEQWEVKFNTYFYDYLLGIRLMDKARWDRIVNVYHEGDIWYYNVSDNVKNTNLLLTEDIQFNLNGNGNHTNGESSFQTILNGLGNVHGGIWSHPCMKDDYPVDNFKMVAALSAQINNQSPSTTVSVQSGSVHGNDGAVYNSISPPVTWNGGDRTNALAGGHGQITKTVNSQAGYHARIHKTLPINPGEEVHFSTTIQVLNCLDNTTPPPQVQMNQRYTSHLLAFYKPDTFYNFHFSRSTQTTTTDTAINPFLRYSGAIFETNAKEVMLSYSIDRIKKSGNCISYSNFRKCSVRNGKLLKYHDTTYIESNKYITAFYTWTGKFKYSGYIEADSACTVKFFLPDMEPGYIMTALTKEGAFLDSVGYDTSTFIMTIKFDSGYTEFEMMLADPCQLSCYFPPTAQTIDTTFNFNTGGTETLGHKLDITQPEGRLNITGGSHMRICQNMYLRNRDSLFLTQSNCNIEEDKKGFSIGYCVDPMGGNPSSFNPAFRTKGKRVNYSKITVGYGAALVLDSGSYTYIGNNCRIYVLEGGNLIIKKNAHLEIGNAQQCGHAEVVAYPGSYVHLEDSSYLSFYKVEGDTVDKQLFYLSIKPTNIETQKGISSTLIKTILVNDGVVDTNTVLKDFCDIEDINPPYAEYGIKNRDWGNCYAIKPLAYIGLPDDTLCPTKCYTVPLDRLLNNYLTQVKICRYDTTSYSPTIEILETCDIPTEAQKGHITVSDTPWCDTLEHFKPNLKLCEGFYSMPNRWYKIKVRVENMCGDTDYIEVPYYNMPLLDTKFSIPDTACSGTGTITATNLSTVSASKGWWHVHVLDPDTSHNNINNPSTVQYGGDWEFDEIEYGETFAFPDFRFMGGLTYAVSLTLHSRCGDSTYWDTVHVHPGAYVSLRHPTVYSAPLAPNSLLLTGYVLEADSFEWTPTTWMQTPDSLETIISPEENIDYVLSAYKGACVQRDTAYVKFNTLAHAGYTDTVCYNADTVMLGYGYDGALLLGWLYYYGSSDVINILDDHRTHHSDYLRYFTHFMYHDDSHNKLFNNPPWNFGSTFVNDLNKQLIIKQTWYKHYYKEYIDNIHDPASALTWFADSIHNNASLEAHFDSLLSWNTSIRDRVSELFDDFDNTFTDGNHHTDIECTWERYASDTVALSNWDNYFMIIDTPIENSRYVISVVNSVTPLAEIDEVTIVLNDTLSPLFAKVYQTDSTAYFANMTTPDEDNTTYSWDFGDGTSSTDQNPIHSFPAFDSSYRVCLTATNRCGSFAWCDTVAIDSLGLMMNFRTPSKPKQNGTGTITNKEQFIEYIAESKMDNGIGLQNYPNPFDNSTTIEYIIAKPYLKAELKITDVLGREITSFALNKPLDKVTIQANDWRDGMYFCSLVIDGKVAKSTIMLLGRK